LHYPPFVRVACTFTCECLKTQCLLFFHECSHFGCQKKNPGPGSQTTLPPRGLGNRFRYFALLVLEILTYSTDHTFQ
jgi:hypothetical protein